MVAPRFLTAVVSLVVVEADFFTSSGVTFDASTEHPAATTAIVTDRRQYFVSLVLIGVIWGTSDRKNALNRAKKRRIKTRCARHASGIIAYLAQRGKTLFYRPYNSGVVLRTASQISRPTM